MGQHYTSNTQSVALWCNRCKNQTQHRVTDHRANDCLDCIQRAEDQRKAQRSFEIESVIATRAHQVEVEVKKREGLPLPMIEVPEACSCEAYEFPHFHCGEDEEKSRRRFKVRFAPLGCDGQRIPSFGPRVDYFAGSRGGL